MSLASLLSGHPSMSALLQSQTGLRDPADTGEQGYGVGAPAPLPPKHGLAGFFDRAMNPTNTLGQFGRALVMAGGTPLGTAYALMDQQKATAGNAALDRQYKQAQIAHLGAGPDPDEFTRTLLAAGIDPKSTQGVGMYANKARHDADPIQSNVIQESDGNGGFTTRVVGIPYSQLYGASAGQSPPGALAPQATPSAGLGLAEQQPDQAPDPAEYQRFVSSLRPELRDAANRAYQGGDMGALPTGSPLSPSNPGVRMVHQGRSRPAAQTKSIGGKTYFNVGGQWFDNPEGR